MKNITKDQLVNILKDTNLNFQVKHFYLHEYIKNHEESSFSEGITNYKNTMFRDQRDVYDLKLSKGNINYTFMTTMNIHHDGHLYFYTTIQDSVPIPNQTYIDAMNEEFISLVEELL